MRTEWEVHRVVVFCGSSFGYRPEYRRVAEELGRRIASADMGLVYGGGRVGLMGALADAALAAGGEVIGVIPTFLQTAEIRHPGLTQTFEVATMHERKAKMVELASAFVALPGGLGTLEELLEVSTWNQLGLVRAPVVVVNTLGYFAPLSAQLERAVGEGFVHRENANWIVFAEDPADAVLLVRQAIER